MITTSGFGIFNSSEALSLIKQLAKRDKIILLERGQVFHIQGNIYFTFGGASSHDIDGGILDKNSATYPEDYRDAIRSGKPFRVLNESWWEQELPTEEEIQEGRENLERVNYQVDYVITHCCGTKTQEKIL